MATFSERLRSLRREKNWSQQRLAEELKISKSSVNMYERGEREPSFETLIKLSRFFGTTIDYLIGKTDTQNVPPGFEPMPDMDQVPLIGRIACGQPITAEQNIEDFVDVPEGIRCDFCLRCKGDSMIDAGINGGDIVYIRQQPEVENGQIAAVRIDGEATLKRVFWDAEHQTLTLLAENRNFPPLVYTGPTLNTVHIEGRAVGFTHWF